MDSQTCKTLITSTQGLQWVTWSATFHWSLKANESHMRISSSLMQVTSLLHETLQVNIEDTRKNKTESLFIYLLIKKQGKCRIRNTTKLNDRLSKNNDLQTWTCRKGTFLEHPLFLIQSLCTPSRSVNYSVTFVTNQ